MDRGKCTLTESLVALSNMVQWAKRLERVFASVIAWLQPNSPVCVNERKQISAQNMVKYCNSARNNAKGGCCNHPSLNLAVRVKGSTHNKYLCKVRGAFSRSHIRNLPLNAFLHQPWNIHALCKVFMWTSVQVSPQRKSAETLKRSNTLSTQHAQLC